MEERPVGARWVLALAAFAVPVTGLGVAVWLVPATLARALETGGGAAALGVVPLSTVAMGLALRRRLARWPRDIAARRSLRALAGVLVLEGLSAGAILGLLASAGGARDTFVSAVYGDTLLPSWLGAALASDASPLHGLAGALGPWVTPLLAADVALRVATLALLAGLWFTVPAAARSRIWLALDAALGAAFVAASFALPLVPPNDSASATQRAVLRLAITVVFIARALARALPHALDAVERVGFRALIAARHLRTRSSRFVSAIGVLSVLAVAFSSCSLTTTLSVMGGFRNDLKRKILGNTPHVVVADANQEGLSDFAALTAEARGAEGVVGASPYVAGEVMLSSATNLAGAVLRGIDVASVGSVTDLQRNLRRGKLEYLAHPERIQAMPASDLLDPLPLRRGGNLGPDPAEALGETAAPKDDTAPTLPGIVIGQELARSLRLYVGDEVNVVSPLGDLGPTGPIPKSRPFRVAGVFYSGMYEYDLKNVYVTLEAGQRFLGTGPVAHGIDLRVRDPDDAPGTARRLATTLGPTVAVRDWQELNRNLFGALALEKLAMFVALGLSILVAGFCVFGTITLMVQEKGREVGVLQALGASRRDILRIFLAEGLLIGVCGALLGLGLGFVVCYGAKHIGIGMNPEVYYIDRLPVHLDALEFTLVGLAASLVCVTATVLPAWLASRTRPVDALRFS